MSKSRINSNHFFDKDINKIKCFFLNVLYNYFVSLRYFGLINSKVLESLSTFIILEDDLCNLL